MEFSSEKEFQQWLITHLRELGWITYTEKRQEKYRPDIIIYRDDVQQYIGLELKASDKLYYMTTALKQIMKYQNTPMTPQPTLWAVAVPSFSEKSWSYERFFWRFGIGTLDTRKDTIIYVNEGRYNKNRVIYLGEKNSVRFWEKNTPENIASLAEKIKKDYVIWNVN